MIKGVIIKGISSFYYVYVDGNIYECKARGNFKAEKIIPLVGDIVDISIIDEDEKKGVVEKIYPRKNSLVRPPIANIDKALLVFAIKDPNPNLSLIDRFIVLAQEAGLNIILCFTKADLDDSDRIENLKKIYSNVGYPVIFTSAVTGENIENIKNMIKDEIVVIAGPSGAGKSTLINTLGFKVKTGEISEKLGRGKHTTRHVELLQIDGNSWIADTPGFSSLTLNHIPEEELKEYFIEFHEYDMDCKFGNKCLHYKEPGCEVKEAVDKELISKERYESYIQLLNEIKEYKMRRGY